jgi:predicted nucleic acid-binding protein
MNGIDFFVDTNILIYILTGHPHPEISHIAKFTHGISTISEIELLGRKDIGLHEADIIRGLLNNCKIVNLNDTI